MLEEIDIIDSHSGLLENMLCCGDGCLHDVLGLHSTLTICLDGRKGLETMLLGPFPGCNNEG